MALIQVLSDELASQVAAGEVVERPASVVKELVENSLDAGAKEIWVEIQRGGIALIRVGDDGVGMSRENALKSLQRHATSKLRSVEGLEQIGTLGFRGEAIPSIASVARFRMLTRTEDEIAGTEIEVGSDELIDFKDAGCPVGTLIEVRDLFYKIPARRKFLKTESTEAAHIEHELRLHALAAADVRFRYRKDGRDVFDLPGGMGRFDRLRHLLGTETGKELIALPHKKDAGISVEGYVLPAKHARRGRRHQCVFLNGRPVTDPVISRGLSEGFRGAVQNGLHPAAWLWIEMDPRLVDVNVHPAKREVRFRRPHDLRRVISLAVEEGLRRQEEKSLPSLPPTRVNQTAEFTKVNQHWQRREWEQELPIDEGKKSEEGRGSREEETEQKVISPIQPRRPNFRLIGTLLDYYALFESEDGLVVMDPRAARERIFYERWLQGKESEPETQGLLVPHILELEPREANLLLQNRALFASAGFELEEFGGTSVKIAAIPSFLNEKEIVPLLMGVIDDLAEGASPRARFAIEHLARILAYRTALLEPARPEEAEQLLTQLFNCELPYCAADGRPTITEFAKSELERRFRIGR